LHQGGALIAPMILFTIGGGLAIPKLSISLYEWPVR